MLPPPPFFEAGAARAFLLAGLLSFPGPLPDEGFIQSSNPDSEQSGADLFLTPHPLSSSLSDRQESNATDPAASRPGVEGEVGRKEKSPHELAGPFPSGKEEEEEGGGPRRSFV